MCGNTPQQPPCPNMIFAWKTRAIEFLEPSCQRYVIIFLSYSRDLLSSCFKKRHVYSPYHCSNLFIPTHCLHVLRYPHINFFFFFFSLLPQNYTDCACVGPAGSRGYAVPGTCGNNCAHLLVPFMIFSSLTCFLASLSQTPSFMMILRYLFLTRFFVHYVLLAESHRVKTKPFKIKRKSNLIRPILR